MSIYDNVAAGLKRNNRKVKKADLDGSSRRRCAGRTCGRRSRTASTRRAWGSPADSGSACASRAPRPLVEIHETDKIFSNPSDKRTEGYVTVDIGEETAFVETGLSREFSDASQPREP